MSQFFTHFTRTTPDGWAVKLFGVQHLIILGFFFLCTVLLWKKRETLVKKDLLRTPLAMIMLAQITMIYSWYFFTGYSGLSQSLPLYNCRFAIIVTAITLLKDNKFGRTISLLLLPIYIFISILGNVYYQKSNYINYQTIRETPNLTVNELNYEDFIVRNDAYTNVFSIQSKVIQDNYIKIKIPISKDLDDKIFELNSKLKPKLDARGYNIEGINIIDYDITERQEDFFKTFQKNYFFKIDSVVYKPDFVIAYKKRSLWFETYIGIKHLEEGKHRLSFVKYKSKHSKDLEVIKTIPFWYYKDAPKDE